MPAVARNQPVNNPEVSKWPKPVEMSGHESSSLVSSQMSVPSDTQESRDSGISEGSQESPIPDQDFSFDDILESVTDCLPKNLSFPKVKEPFPLALKNDKTYGINFGDSLLGESSDTYDEDEGIFEDLERSFTPEAENESQLPITKKCEDEPLYQFYQENDILQQQNFSDCNSQEDEDDVFHVPTPMPLVDLKGKFPSSLLLVDPSTQGQGQRKFWAELPEVVESGLLQRISLKEWKEQEAMFEFMTSEAFFLRSLLIFVNLFARNSFFDPTSENYALNQPSDHKVLFHRIHAVKEVCQKFLADLEKKWQENLLVSDICDVILKYTNNNGFEPYVTYCRYQNEQEETYDLLLQNPKFVEALETLESHPLCTRLSMKSFFTLPVQRITRYPLLLKAILKQRIEGTPGFRHCQKALTAVNKVVKDCNKAIVERADLFKVAEAWNKINWHLLVYIPSMNKNRKFVKEGELSLLALPDKRSSKIKPLKSSVWLFLFSDILILCKKSNRGNLYDPIDYCLRSEVEPSQNSLPPCLTLNQDKNLSYFKLIFLFNMEQKNVEYYFQENMQNEAVRWIVAICPPIEGTDSEKIFHDFDSPQVQVINHYTALELDELSLEPGDVISVVKTAEDGWYYGLRLHDGAKGWFPSNFTVEIFSREVKSRNLHLRLRKLDATESMWRTDCNSRREPMQRKESFWEQEVKEMNEMNEENQRK